MSFMSELARPRRCRSCMVSSENPEVIGMSDRVIVMAPIGRIAGRVIGDALAPETLVRHAAASRPPQQMQEALRSC